MINERPTIKPIVNTELYQLVGDYETSYGFTIPDGYKFDGASIPRWLWFVFGGPFSPQVVRAALIHDYMYGIEYDRKEADNIFKKNLKEDGVTSVKSSLMRTGVRAFGWLFYGKK